METDKNIKNISTHFDTGFHVVQIVEVKDNDFISEYSSFASFTCSFKNEYGTIDEKFNISIKDYPKIVKLANACGLVKSNYFEFDTKELLNKKIEIEISENSTTKYIDDFKEITTVEDKDFIDDDYDDFPF